uniref:G-protein coupled receptors family 1 profile domain-containing protein n=1 Tax=Setaria digitata TaxID=48799 RepID=A0A915PP19_9BILA
MISSQLRNRREIQIICALSIADFVEAFATLCAGIYRMLVILLDLKDKKFNLFQCMLLPHSWLWRWSDFATSFMLLTITFDRLFSVVFPLKYMRWRSTYSCIAIGTPYTLSILLSMFAWHRPITTYSEISMLCMNVYISPNFYKISKYLTAASSIMSIILYIPTVLIVRIQKKHMSRVMTNSQMARQRRAQIRMTMTLGFSCLVTFFLDAMPRAVGIYGGLGKNTSPVEKQCESAVQVLFHLTKLNSIINLFLYYHRNPALRESILNVIRVCYIEYYNSYDIRQENFLHLSEAKATLNQSSSSIQFKDHVTRNTLFYNSN